MKEITKPQTHEIGGGLVPTRGPGDGEIPELPLPPDYPMGIEQPVVGPVPPAAA